MTHRHVLLALAVTASLLSLSACKKAPSPGAETPASTAIKPPPAGETADQFIARVNAELKSMYPELTAAQWLSSTYINDESELLSAKSNERYLTQLKSWIEQAKRFEGKQMSADTARAITLLKLGTSLPPPNDPAKLAELTQLATKEYRNFKRPF